MGYGVRATLVIVAVSSVVYAGCASSENDVTNPVDGGSDAAGGAATDSGKDAAKGGGSATGGSGGNSGGSAGAGGSGADAGTGCAVSSECPAPANECVEAQCVNGACTTANEPAGTPTSSQTAGDCRENRCDGAGKFTVASDDSDLPDDKNPCTNDLCNNGSVSHTPVTAGTSCGASLTCDSSGKCVGCSSPASCPGQDTECTSKTCVAGSCGMVNATPGKITGTQVGGDCKVNQCDGSGNVVSVNDTTDVPNDNKQCTIDSCVGATPTHTPVNAGAACSESGGKVCNGSGSCVACTAPGDCPGSDTECSVRTCAGFVCGVSNVGAGTATASQVAGDCKKNVCNGSGGIVSQNDDTDVPNDNKQCTNDVCSAGVPSHPPKGSGTPCNESGGKVCDGGVTCVECTTSAHCTVGTCQNNVCQAGTCNPGTIDCDGTTGNGCECSGSICCGATCSPPHINGLGQSYDDCAPLGVPGSPATYSIALATKARAAWPVSGTDLTGQCNPGAMAALVRQTATSCAVWVYEKTMAGYVRLNTANNQCQCPGVSDPTWR